MIATSDRPHINEEGATNRTRTSPRMRRSTISRVVASMVAAFLACVAGAAPAGAHAQLRTITPADGTQLNVAPGQVTLTFNEIVTGKAQSVQVLSSAGKIVARSGAFEAQTVTVYTPKLVKDRYVVRWSIISADGHPIVGATAFSVKTATPKTSPVTVALTGAQGKLAAKFTGTRAGAITVTAASTASEGELQLRNPKFGAPLIWPVKAENGTVTAAGMIPSAGTWDVTLKLRVSQFDEYMYTGKITVTK